MSDATHPARARPSADALIDGPRVGASPGAFVVVSPVVLELGVAARKLGIAALELGQLVIVVRNPERGRLVVSCGTALVSFRGRAMEVTGVRLHRDFLTSLVRQRFPKLAEERRRIVEHPENRVSRLLVERDAATFDEPAQHASCSVGLAAENEPVRDLEHGHPRNPHTGDVDHEAILDSRRPWARPSHPSVSRADS